MSRRSRHSTRATYPRTVTFKKAKSVHPKKPRAGKVRKMTIKF